MERMNRQGRSRTVISTIVYGIMALVLLSGCSLQATDTASEQVWGEPMPRKSILIQKLQAAS